jgi:hypothetical protein
MRILLLLAVLSTAAWAGPVALKVDAIGDKDTDILKKAPKKGGGAERVITDNRQLEITVSNTTGGGLQNLTVIYYIFAQDVKAKEVVLAKKREKTISLSPLGKLAFSTETAIMTLHPAFSKSSGGKMTPVPASGYKFAGYGVQVLAGDAVLAELFEPRELKTSTGLAETSTLYDEGKWKKKKAN